MEAIIYNQKGKEAGKIELPQGVFDAKWNPDLVHQVVTSMLSSRRTPVAHTKTRGEVRGGGKKPWRQKGTGRARHGSMRSPIWVGGGVSHGPRNDKNFTRLTSKGMKTSALFSILSKKMGEGEIMFVDALKLSAPKTAEAKGILSALSGIKGFEKMKNKKTNCAYVALHKAESATEKSFRNFNNIAVDEARNMNPVDVLKYKYLVIENPKEVFKFLEAKKK